MMDEEEAAREGRDNNRHEYTCRARCQGGSGMINDAYMSYFPYWETFESKAKLCLFVCSCFVCENCSHTVLV